MSVQVVQNQPDHRDIGVSLEIWPESSLSWVSSYLATGAAPTSLVLL